VDDSTRLAASERERLARLIRRRALSIALGAASVREIDRLNIYHASALAMRRAIARLQIVPDHVVVDGRPIRSLGVAHTAVVGGDARCFSVACASIVAKVTRDRLMVALARRHPAYRWERNVGYGTPDHHAGLDRHGLSPHHRRSFVRGRQLLLPLADSPADLDRAVATTLADAIERESPGLPSLDVAGFAPLEMRSDPFPESDPQQELATPREGERDA
jgi:ribonuclease HII